MNKNLLENLECNAPSVKVENGYKKQGRGVLGLVLLAVFGVFFGGTAWGQQDLSGVYYIANNADYSTTDITKNWYLVPASDPHQEHYADAYFHNQYCNMTGSGDYTGENYGDPEKPFLTTYKTSKDAAAIPEGVNAPVDNSIWIVKAVSGESGMYNLIHAATGKYVVLEPPYQGDQSVKAVHLLSTDNPGENAKYEITVSSGNYNIRAKQLTGNSTNRFFNPNSKNLASYYGTGNNYFQQGLIGVYKDSGGNSRWKFESARCQAPVATNTALGHYDLSSVLTTSLPSIYTILYTLDGDDPTATTGTPYDPSVGIDVTTNQTLRAVVVGYGMVVSNVLETMLYAVTPAPTFEVLCANELQINCAVPGAEIYYSTTVTNPTNETGIPYVSPVSGLSDNDLVYAVAYSFGSPSAVADITYHPNTTQPTIAVNPDDPSVASDKARINFVAGATIYYTTNGTDPVIGGSNTTSFSGDSPLEVSFPSTQNKELRVIAKLPDRGASCPAVVKKRPKKPTINPVSVCYGTTRTHELTFTSTENGKTYYYALKNGSDQSVPAWNAFTQYTVGNVVDIASLGWNHTSLSVTLFAYAKDAEGNRSVVHTQNYNIKFTDAPTITHSGTSVTINRPSTAPSATIHYTIDGGNELTYSQPFTVSSGQSHIITATAKNGSEGESCETVYAITLSTTISSLQELNGMNANGAYVLGGNIDVNDGYTTMNSTFTGSFDGAGYSITGLTQPLFSTTDGAVIHDVNLKGVNISTRYTADTVGAIACVAKGYTRIYNCGILPNTKDFADDDHPTVAATKCAGSIVGSLRDNSRVVNCFSYADVSSSGYAAGIVGNNAYASTAEVSGGKYTKLRTMVVNCMYYGDITNGSNVWPVYGGQKITNAGSTAINNYNFYSDSCSFPVGKEPSATNIYNCSWPAKYEYLTRYEFHRYLLNSNRELCGWWVGAPYAPSTMTTSDVQAVPKDASLMAKWVLDREEAPFPILKPFGKYSSPINIDADSSWRESANAWEGKKLGTLKVTVKSGTHHSAADEEIPLTITDMDTLHGDYCYRKVQLPYYNTVFGDPEGDTWVEKYAHNYTDSVVTGWEITITNGAPGTFMGDKNITNPPTGYTYSAKAWQNGFNFADRTGSLKDLYAVSDRVFAQGGYYYVPYDVTAITITAHWGKAVYLGNGDRFYDRVDFKHNDDNVRPGTPFAPAGIRNENIGDNQTYQTIRSGKIATVATDQFKNGTVYDNALVLVGNHQYCTGGQDVKPNGSFTIMSVDLDFDNEPDYCLDWQLGVGTTRQQFCPLRIDFLPVVEIGLGLKKDGSKQFYSLGCYRPSGHFEVTETALIRFGQFEFSNVNRSVYAPLILNGGIYEQYVKSTKGNAMSTADDKINYIIVGGNVYMYGFTPGAHVNENANFPTRHCAVNALGGKFNKFFLTGNFNEKVKPNQDSTYAYIDGGKFDHVASAGKEGIYGDVTWRINHARIKEFYGGGVMAEATGDYYKIVKGSINVVVDNSIVDKYCGGPKFGDMVTGKTVTTNATGTTFGVYYGAGNGGTNYVQYDKTDVVAAPYSNATWNSTVDGKYHPRKYRSRDQGYEADYEYEVINTSTGTDDNKVVNRSYYYSAQFATTNTGIVTNTLKDCVVKKNFYGAGFLGGVNGNVISTLTDTEVRGSAYGGGYSASTPEVKIYNKDKGYPIVDIYSGYIAPSTGGTSTTYTWTHKTDFGETTLSTNNPAITGQGANHDENYFYTEDPLENLGTVTGSVTLTIKGKSTIGTFENGVVKHGTGNVYGGGDESTVGGNTLVKILDRTKVLGNIYGGGNRGTVGGDTKVIINGEVPETGNSATGGSGNNN